MLDTEVADLLDELKSMLCRIYGDNLYGVYLYGSRATQDQDAESDVDVAIVLREFGDYWQEIKRTGAFISDLSLKYDVSISPVRIREKSWVEEDSPFLHNVRKECVEI